jgi:hypothetical protein
MKKLHFLAAIVIATFATSKVNAQAGISTPTTVCLSASKDALIHQWVPTTNYGSLPILQSSRWTYDAGGGSGFYTTKALLQFDLSSLPAGVTITSAVMKLHVDPTATIYNQHRDLGGGTGNGATVNQVSSSWNESSVTWNTPLSIMSSPASIPSLGDGSTADVIADVTVMVQNIMLTGINNGFQISLTDNSDYYHSLVFASRENTSAGGIYQPELCVTYSVPCSEWSTCGNTTTGISEFLGTINNQPLTIKTNNTNRAVITATGEMGIGTSTPTSQLEVTSVPTAGQTAIKAIGKSTGVFGEATDMNVGQTADGILAGWTEAVGVFGKGTYASNVGNGNMYGVVGSATGLNPLNNVGVYGEAKNASGYNSGVIGTVTSTTGAYNTGTSGQVYLNTSAAWNRAIAGYAPIAPNHFAGYFDGNVDIKSGVVTIGNGTLCTPTGYKLFVEEGILTEKVKVAVNCSTAWADYVFANDYKLKPLSEVEAYVKENKHLPNIPSASELVNDGLNLGEMQAKQMEKIEELTLYMIEMKKEIDTLKKENQSLKVLVAQPKN